MGKRRWEIFREKYLPELHQTPGARELAEQMKSDGLKLVVASSAGGNELGILLEVAGVADLMDATMSSTAKESKPDPDIVKAAIRSSRIEAEHLIMLGDTPYDVEAALGAHGNLVALLCGGWSMLELSGATAIYDDPANLLRWYHSSPFSVGTLAG